MYHKYSLFFAFFFYRDFFILASFPIPVESCQSQKKYKFSFYYIIMKYIYKNYFSTVI